VAECAALLKRQMEAIGVPARVVPTAGHPVVYGEVQAPGAKRTVLIYGHYDVQPPEPLELWHTPPFEPTIKDGRIWGRGTGDNKGQFFTYLKAVEALLLVEGRRWRLCDPCGLALSNAVLRELLTWWEERLDAGP